jgi:hypothetical protein
VSAASRTTGKAGNGVLGVTEKKARSRDFTDDMMKVPPLNGLFDTMAEMPIVVTTRQRRSPKSGRDFHGITGVLHAHEFS